MTRLVIVESPSKAKKIQGYLGRGFTVLASMGHVRDLPPKALGVAVEERYEPSYHVLRGKGKVIARIRAAVREAEAIYLATDPDREGEAIAWHVLEAVGAAARGKPVFRVSFTEITAPAVRAAFERPRALDMDLVNAQQARRVLDRLVGWKVSPVLRHAFGVSLSAGRVQSVAVRLVAEREAEIDRFVPEQSWTVEADFQRQEGEQTPFHGRLAALLAPADEGLDPLRLPTERAARIAEELSAPEVNWQVGGVDRREQRRAAPPPFVTSTMQQKASSKLKMAPKQSMRVAQGLYEKGLITYMRTDSPAVAQPAQAAAREVIASLFGQAALPRAAPQYRARGNAQEAHEAIRPTEPAKLPKDAGLSGKEARLYRLIWMRFIASQMGSAVYDVTVATIEPRVRDAGKPYLFEAKGRLLKIAGWLRVYGVRPGGPAAGDDEEKEEAQRLPPLSAADPLRLLALLPREHWTKPPPRFTEPSLIRALEKAGVGRPSTYAAIMDTIQSRGYVEKKGKSLAPTRAGREVTGYLTEHFPDLLDLGFTRQMEEDLDRVAGGEVAWDRLLDGFYHPLTERIALARGVEADVTLAEPCAECGTSLVEKFGRYGKYRLCPSCGHRPDAAPAAGRDCPECGKPLLRRKGKYGPFLGCSGYPECTFIEKGQERDRSRSKGTLEPESRAVIGKPCPECGKEMVERQGRYGPFAGCSGYPDCRFIFRAAGGRAGGARAAGPRTGPPPTPLAGSGGACPKCGSALVARTGRRGPFVGCSGYPRCRYIARERAGG